MQTERQINSVQSREVWAGRISEAYGKTVEAVFDVGRALLLAKRELPHGEFVAMVERELPFSVNTAQRYMAIAHSDNLQKMTIGHLLPSSWRTLDVLARLDKNSFDAAVVAGKIHPEMTRAEADALLPKKPLAPVVPIADSLHMPIDEAMRVAVDAALEEGGRKLAAYAERQIEDKRCADLADQRVPPDPMTIAEESLSLDALRRLRELYALLQSEQPKMQFRHRWGEAARLASAILKQVEALS